VPGQHGGFETFAEHLAAYLADKGWEVTVYCQAVGPKGTPVTEDFWRKVHRVHIPVPSDTAAGSMRFDYRSIRLAMHRQSPCLVLGYNTACLTLLLRGAGVRFATNMDGIEWKRGKWSLPFKAWFYANDWIGCLVSDHLIADHPDIARHLATRTDPRKITMIPYGADPIEAPDPEPLRRLGVEPGRFFVSICRPEPENSVLEVVRAFGRAPRGMTLVVLGKFHESSPYHAAVRAAAGPEVIFPGAIYDTPTLHALRAHAHAYCHGHTVGGTNPSLVEALGAGSAVIAHDNPFNRWVAGDRQFYFADEDGCAARIEEALANEARIAGARAAARQRFLDAFTWDRVLDQYETLLDSLVSRSVTGTLSWPTHRTSYQRTQE
jgi:glycosyltransferase involved in cell wall biosynthesis